MMEPTAAPQTEPSNRTAGQRHSILDLAPLELECMSALWSMGEGTVRDLHRELSNSRRRAYTTILTIMDRLAQKGIVMRHKAGRAYLYRANLSAEEARMKAVEKIVAGFFAGSPEALAAHLAAQGGTVRSFPPATVADEEVKDKADDVPRHLVEEIQFRNLDETLL
jgi:predicted transcriptional regulator